MTGCRLKSLLSSCWGFLDGKEGFIWHFLQGFWYRFLVDAKIYEIKKRFGWNDKRIKAFIKETYLDK